MAETYRRKPPVYTAAQLTSETAEEVYQLLRGAAGIPDLVAYTTCPYISVTGDKWERAQYRDYRIVNPAKPEFPLYIHEGDWVVVSYEGVQIHSDVSFQERFERDI